MIWLQSLYYTFKYNFTFLEPLYARLLFMIRVRRAFLLALIVCAITFYAIAGGMGKERLLYVYFLDIGQGDSIYVRTPNGHDILVDGGPSATVLQKLSEVMPWGDRSIDVVMESHPDADHIGGLPEILRRYDVGMFIEPGIESNNSIDDELHRIIKGKNIPIVFARRGMRIDFGDGAVFDILFPDDNVSEMSDTNSASIVGQVRYGRTAFMLNGDSPKAIENHLLFLDGSLLASNVLKAGHHGSRTSSGEDYLRTVNPEYAVISAGEKNRYGHPHKEVTDILAQFGIKTFMTYESGTIGFVSDGKDVLPK